MNTLIIDNYDSFTYNLVHYVGELGSTTKVVRNDAMSVDEIAQLRDAGDISHIIISPGPCTPNEAGICLELVDKIAGTMPILGVCLGHQTIAQSFGAEIIRGDEPVHGKVHNVTHNNEGIFKDIASPLEATRYHSLIVKNDTLPECLSVTAQTEDGVIMGIAHNDGLTHGVQFHPESIATEYGHDMIKNFLRL